ncbi:hypothetical protein HUK80_09295 [Flavobacterium sp. MAH-1]|uniref:Uncharacterized protein n=1 Tax=Flavobacterium agri TaxID=2743471 RepID=A0A7Y8Y248_9FLAO|nr:hypothetical protein [Flavobacterium agri]NUY81088.1 hypothetical protein [Flavobacterium agri]NYA71112.1 hypothetical protein [Flavobacterium agri]
MSIAFLKKALSALVFFVGTMCFAQDPAVLKSVSELYDSNYNMDFEPIAELTYPKVVEQLGGKQKFLEKLDSDYQNEKFRKRLQLTAPVFQVNQPKTIEGRQFCVVSYRNPTRYFYENKMDAAEMNKEVEQWKRIASTKEVFGEPNRNSINVKRISKFVAVSDSSTGGQWKFFNLDDLQQLEIFNELFAAEKTQLGL